MSVLKNEIANQVWKLYLQLICDLFDKWNQTVCGCLRRIKHTNVIISCNSNELKC